MTASTSGGLCQPAHSSLASRGRGVWRVMMCQVLWMPPVRHTHEWALHTQSLSPSQKCLSARAAAMLLVGEPTLKPGQRPRGSSMPAAHRSLGPESRRPYGPSAALDTQESKSQSLTGQSVWWWRAVALALTVEGP